MWYDDDPASHVSISTISFEMRIISQCDRLGDYCSYTRVILGFVRLLLTNFASPPPLQSWEEHGVSVCGQHIG
eukprot:COSAG02_NODE_1704_length_11240_cov_9.848308_9_plen_73_part_00